jgi:membrane protein insertase Oxa1/YidC/SpoIIIJ
MNWKKLEEKESWDEEHLIRARRIIEGEGADYAHKWNSFVYWFALIVAIIGNFLVNIALLPIFMTMGSFTVLLSLAVTGVCFGLLFTLILRDLELADPKHHVIAGIFLPIFAGIVSFVTVRLSNQVVETVSTQVTGGAQILATQSVIFIPIVYIIAFTLPYLLSLKGRLFF